MRRSTLALGLLACVLLTVPLVRGGAGVEAGTAVRMDVPDLVRHADLIVEGRVLSLRSYEDRGRIETEYLLQVERTFEGEDQPLRSVRMPGGELPDGRGLLLAGMPRLALGERTLLFLSAEGRTGIRVPVGLAQGKYAVVQREDGSKAVVRNARGLSLLNPETGEPVPGPGVTVQDYGALVARIEAALVAKRRAK